jgi:hypothetical protein
MPGMDCAAIIRDLHAATKLETINDSANVRHFAKEKGKRV